MSFKSLYLPIDRKSMVLEGDRRGEFVGRASVFGVVDLHGDIVMPGAFAKSIRETQGRTKLLYQHDTRRPIGIGEIVETSDALIVKGRLSLATRDAQEAYALMLDGVLDGLSIGYDTVRADKPKGGVRKLHELKLYEVSVVTFPANVLATIEAIKYAAGRQPDPAVADFLSFHSDVCDYFRRYTAISDLDRLKSDIKAFASTLGAGDLSHELNKAQGALDRFGRAVSRMPRRPFDDRYFTG